MLDLSEASLVLLSEASLVLLSEASLIILASALLSVLLALGLFLGWSTGRRLSGRRYTYLLYYAMYLFAINIPKLTMAVFGYVLPPYPRLVMDIVEVTLIFLAAESWTSERTTFRRWLILVPAYAAGVMVFVTGSDGWVLVQSLSFGLVLLLTVYNISRNAPWPVALAVSASFGSWVLLEALLPQSGPPVGHAFGMLVKVMLMGSVMFSTYERQHRDLWQAAMVRKRAIQIIASGESGMTSGMTMSDIDFCDMNNRHGD
jgi:hypothetical protein